MKETIGKKYLYNYLKIPSAEINCCGWRTIVRCSFVTSTYRTSALNIKYKLNFSDKHLSKTELTICFCQMNMFQMKGIDNCYCILYTRLNNALCS